MSDYVNGCRSTRDCPGKPTYIYRPQGGFPVGYCVSCMPGFLRTNVASLETTAGYEKIMEQMYAALAAETPAAPKKPRRRRKKAEAPVVEEAAAPEQPAEEPVAEQPEAPAEEATEETPSE